MINLENCSIITKRIYNNIRISETLHGHSKGICLHSISEEISELIRIIDPKLGEDLDALYAMQELVDKLYHE